LLSGVRDFKGIDPKGETTMMTSMLVPAKAKLISGFHPKSRRLKTTRKVKELMDAIAYEASDPKYVGITPPR
jgi:hypothetical protein